MTPLSASTALVVAAHGRRGLIETTAGRRQFVIKGRSLRVVCGDRVSFEQRAGSESLLVTAIAPRTNVLARVNQRTAADEVIAANLTQLLAVCAPRPEPDFFLLDRYLCAAELMDCRPVLLWNKCDLAALPPSAFRDYRNLGYQVVAVSTRVGEGLETLSELLAGQVSVLVGQSGVGKSSLVNALIPGVDAVIGELSMATSGGTHTTTAVLMYAVSGTGRLLDTPGVRDFLPAIPRHRRIDRGFPEMCRLADDCRFNDCHHGKEPGCAVKKGLDSGAVSPRRYDSYRRLVDTFGTMGRDAGN